MQRVTIIKLIQNFSMITDQPRTLPGIPDGVTNERSLESMHGSIECGIDAAILQREFEMILEGTVNRYVEGLKSRSASGGEKHEINVVLEADHVERRIFSGALLIHDQESSHIGIRSASLQEGKERFREPLHKCSFVDVPFRSNCTLHEA